MIIMFGTGYGKSSCSPVTGYEAIKVQKKITMKSLSKKLSARILSFAIAIVGMSAGPMANAACDAPPAGIVAWWPGQGNANDIIGTNNGTFVGAVGYTNGEVGEAFVFDGNEQLVSVGNSSALQLQNFTIETWVKRSSASVVTAPGGNAVIFGYGANGYSLYLDQNGTPTLCQIGGSTTQPTVAITSTNFHHLAVTKSGSTVVLYIYCGGYAAPALTCTFTFTTSAAIGGRADNLDNSFPRRH